MSRPRLSKHAVFPRGFKLEPYYRALFPRLARGSFMEAANGSRWQQNDRYNRPKS